MKLSFLFRLPLFLVVLIIYSCGKSGNPAPTVAAPVPLATLGLYEYEPQSSTSKRIFVPVTQVGTQKLGSFSVFDTGSSGLILDGNELLPASDITTSGVVFKTDSLVVNGITVTKTTGTMQYGNQISGTVVYGYLAYAPVTFGDQNGGLTTKRMPFFLYYKVTDQSGNVQTINLGGLDIFGVGPGFSYAISAINSPLLYLNYPAGITSGFKLALLSSTDFTSAGNEVSGLLTVGLTSADLASSSGFILHPLSYFTLGGYSSNIAATVSYYNPSIKSRTTFSGQLLFDTGTPTTTLIEDKNATATIGSLPANDTVSITTNQGFKYQYVTASTANLTAVQNPNNTGDTRTIFAIDFFIKNEFLTDYTDHYIGLKNN